MYQIARFALGIQVSLFIGFITVVILEFADPMFALSIFLMGTIINFVWYLMMKEF